MGIFYHGLLLHPRLEPKNKYIYSINQDVHLHVLQSYTCGLSTPQNVLHVQQYPTLVLHLTKTINHIP